MVTIVQMNASDTSLEATFAVRAKAGGWSQSQAAWIGKLAAAALEGTTDRSAAALDAAYKEAGRKLSAGYFDNALNEGKSRLVAFLTVIDLEKQVAQRSGNPPPGYSEDALKTAYLALAQAAERGASSADQLEAAFATLRASEQK
jgi:hypothetical protein